MFWLIALIITLIIALFLYWQLIITEGAYLGAPLVALMYDWTAERYNKIKEFNDAEEDFCLGAPLANRLRHQPQALVLDVATGTGRIPWALLRQASYQGRLVGLDRAAKMLDVARRDPANRQDRVAFIQADAMALPFADNSFPAVTCLESLEFLPRPEKGLTELIRVLQPASPTHPERGWLLTTQRIGWEARLMPGKTWSRAELIELLEQLPLQQIDIHIWQDIYNLVWAQKVEIQEQYPSE